MKDTLLTIVTPTYNRAHTLSICYNSLCEQTDDRFIWMIIDDGSTDNTEKLVSEWIKDKRVNLEYIKKKNGGKASALNVAIENLSTKYAVCLDSDDFFYPNTVELAIKELSSIENDSNCCGILALRNNPDGSVMGNREIPKEAINITAADVFLKYCLLTELICFYKTVILKRYRFPEFEGEKFVSPAWMQYKITETCYFKSSWNKYCQCEYIEDGLTKNKNKIIINNPKGYTCVKKLSFDLAPSYKLIIKHGIMYNCGCILSKDKDWIKNVKHKIWAVVLRPVSYIILYSRFRNKKTKSK